MKLTQAPRIDAQYLQAAAQTAANFNTLIWRRLGYILAVQYGGIAAAYVLRQTLVGPSVMMIACILSIGLLMAAEADIARRNILLAQVNYLAEGLRPLFEERPPPSDLALPFRIDPLPAPKKTVLSVHWRSVRILFLILVDGAIAATLGLSTHFLGIIQAYFGIPLYHIIK